MVGQKLLHATVHQLLLPILLRYTLQKCFADVRGTDVPGILYRHGHQDTLTVSLARTSVVVKHPGVYILEASDRQTCTYHTLCSGWPRLLALLHGPGSLLELPFDNPFDINDVS